jgi:hypothetical protein
LACRDHGHCQPPKRGERSRGKPKIGDPDRNYVLTRFRNPGETTIADLCSSNFA